ncbi:DUF6194 family protein [Streptomyces sp. NPDC053086]|uniref:DUF6194 family protein n=1 Tax=unclassified Streptomyces TaxID=2593676 RepID=UPI0037D1F900
MEQVIAAVRGFDSVLVVRPQPADGCAQPAWGDAFFYYAPAGQVPANVQPYGTITTRNHPGDTACDLDPPGRWRVNIHVGRAVFVELTGEEPRSLSRPRDHTAPDSVLPHPLYGPLGWICVVNPGEKTHATLVRLLRDAHDAARARFERRHGPDQTAGGN